MSSIVRPVASDIIVTTTRRSRTSFGRLKSSAKVRRSKLAARLDRAKIESLPSCKRGCDKDIVRIPETHRTDKNGNTIEESTVCGVSGTPKTSFVVLRGYQDSTEAEIHMDDSTRIRLGVKLYETYDFQFKPARFYGQLRWAWKASETGYRVASRLGIAGFMLGVLSLLLALPPIVDWIKDLICRLR